VAQLLTLLLVVPGLVALSAPVSLVLSSARRGWQPPQLVSVLADPVNGVALVMVLLAGVYATPLLEASLRHVSVHRLVDVLALAVGLVVMWSLVGVDPAPGPRRSGRDRAVLALLLAVVLISFGVLLVLRNDLLAGAWFSGLHWTWADPVVDQRRAAGVAWAFAQVVVPLLLMVVYLQSAPPVRTRRR
jgi:cytochrome c oxidase assembly factor CtaG